MISAAAPTLHLRRLAPAVARLVQPWLGPLGALAAALLSFWTGGVHLIALATLAVLYALSLLRGSDRRGSDPLGLGPGFLLPALIVGAWTSSALGAVEGLLWGGLVRVFLLEQSRR